jgi:hypothetical protein
LDSSKIHSIKNLILNDLKLSDSLMGISYYKWESIENFKIQDIQCINGDGFVIYTVNINLKDIFYRYDEIKHPKYILFQYKSTPIKYNINGNWFLKISGFYYTELYQLYRSFWNKNIDLFESDINKLDIFSQNEITSIKNYIQCNFNCYTNEYYPIKSVPLQDVFKNNDSHFSNSIKLFYPFSFK